jgi:hypothetical protein
MTVHFRPPHPGAFVWLEPFRRPRPDGRVDRYFHVWTEDRVVYAGHDWRAAFRSALRVAEGHPGIQILFGEEKEP